MQQAISDRDVLKPFTALPDPVRLALSTGLSKASWKRGAVLGSQGEQLRYLVGVVKGVVRATLVNHEGKAIESTDFGPGAMIGWLSVIDGGALDNQLAALTDVDLVLWPIEEARKLLLGNAELASFVLSSMAKTIRDKEANRRLLSLPSAYQRIYVHILKLASAPEKTPDLALPMKQNDIASLVNTSRETVSRALQQLVKQGVVVKEGHKIKIKQPEVLKELAEGVQSSVQ